MNKPEVDRLIQSLRNKYPEISEVLSSLSNAFFELNSSPSPIVVDEKTKVVKLNTQLGSSGEGFLAVPARQAVQMPPGGTDREGILAIDVTNDRFVYYSKAKKFYLTGTEF